MTTVAELVPGDRITLFQTSATFVQRASHPLYPELQLVIWRMADDSWSHDALDARQHVGDVQRQTAEQRRETLRRAFFP